MSRHHSVIAMALALAAVLHATAPPLVAQESGASGTREVIRIGIFELGPFMMTVKNGEAGGASVDIWRELIAPLMGVEIEASGPYPIPRLEKMLEAGEVDVIPYITKIPARESRFLYPSRSFTSITPCIIVRRDSALVAVERQEDLFDLKIGFITSAYIPPLLRHDRIKLDLITATDFRQINHQKLMNGRVDALLDINYVSLLYETNKHGYAQDIRIIPLKQGQTQIYSLFPNSPRGEDLRRRYESALSSIPPRSFDDIVNRYINGER